MEMFYIIAVVCVVFGLVLYMKYDNVSFYEFLGVGLLAFALSGIFHYISFSSMTDDTEIWSGRITSVVYHPRWVEKVQHTETDNKGKTHVSYSYTTHNKYWEAKTNIDSAENISESLFNQLSAKFGPISKQWVYKSGFESGDHNIYVCNNISNYMVPISENRTFTNRIKGSKTVWNYPEVPSDVKVFEYPKTSDWFRSNRLLGSAKTTISIDKFDEMCARIGPAKQANVILVGFDGNSTIEMGNYQESKWIGGKKNDIVVCYGGADSKRPTWVHVFSWTEKDICKINIRNIFMNNSVDDSILPLLEKEIYETFARKHFSDFDYISIAPPDWALPWYIGVVGIVQVCVWTYFFRNDYGKKDDSFMLRGMRIRSLNNRRF